MEDKDSVFVTYDDDIKRLFKEEEQEGVRKILLHAQEQSRKKEILRVREPMPHWKKSLKALQYKLKYGIHWKGPLGITYPIRLARNIFLAKFYKTFGINKFVFRGVEIAVSFDCIFRCTHCLCFRLRDDIEKSDTARKRVLTPEEWAPVVKDAMKMGATTFGLEGGEPLFKKDWREYIKAFQGHYNHIIISTNGFLFTEEVARDCKALGVDTINFSCDSGIGELHDLFRRQKGSFEKVMEGVELCKKYGIKPILNSCIHKGNLYTDGFINLLEYCDKNNVFLSILFAKGIGAFKDKDCMLDDEDIRNYFEITKPYASPYIHHLGHLNYNYGSVGCPGTKEMLNFTPYGDALNCANMHIYFGNILEEPIKVIRERTLKETPFGRYLPCYLTMNQDFMNIYYPLFEKNRHITIDDWKKELKKYELEHKKIVFPHLHENCGSDCEVCKVATTYNKYDGSNCEVCNTLNGKCN